MNRALTAALIVLGPMGLAARAELKTESVRYEADGAACVGYLAYDDRFEGPRPGVLVLHEWWGLNDYAKRRTEMLAELGYVAFAADVYGEGRTTEHPKEAAAMAGRMRQDVAGWRRRAEAGLKVLADQERTDPQRLAAIGYCFGGSTALQLAYGGADLKAVATFHAALPAATAEEAAAVKPELLVCHGAADPFVPPTAVAAFEQALVDGSKVGAAWTVAVLSGAQHGFTVEESDARGLEGQKYDARADAQSWAMMQELFRRTLDGEAAQK